METVKGILLNRNVMRWIFRAWRYRLRTEKHEIEFLLNHLQPGQSVLDIGAHKGAYTYWMSNRVGPEGKVIAFEPQPILNAYITDVVEKSSIKNIQIESTALSSKIGDAVLRVPGNRPSPSASLNKSFDQNGMGISVQTTTLDAYVMANHLPSVDLIKCDVEGHELDVLKSGMETIKRFKPIVMLECEARHNGVENVQDVFNYFKDLNYKGCFHDGQSFTDLENFDIHTYQIHSDRKIYVNNFFFTPIED